jgi:hypothetical protein
MCLEASMPKRTPPILHILFASVCRFPGKQEMMLPSVFQRRHVMYVTCPLILHHHEASPPSSIQTRSVMFGTCPLILHHQEASASCPTGPWELKRHRYHWQAKSHSKLARPMECATAVMLNMCFFSSSSVWANVHHLC